MNQRIFIFVLVLCDGIVADLLPSYIKPCLSTDSIFNDCALEHANLALPYIIKGDRKFHIPPLNPLQLPLVDIRQSNFKLTLKDVEVYGFENARVTKIDFSKSHVNIVMHIDVLNIISNYKMDGKILLLILHGNGASNITAVGGDYNLKAEFQNYQKRGEAHLKFINPTLDFKLEKAYFHFENLLNDQRLGTEINDLLNENWRDVLQDLGAPIKETIVTIITSIVSSFLEIIPIKYIFPE